MPSFSNLPGKVVQRIFEVVDPADISSLSLVTKATFELARPYNKKRRNRQWRYREMRFYWEESCSFLIPITHPDDSYSHVVRNMIEFLEKVHLQPDIAGYVKNLWMPGPRYSCESNDKIGSFPTQIIRLIEAEITRCIQPQYLGYYLKDDWQVSQCLSTVLITATMFFLLPNIKKLVCSGGPYFGVYGGDSGRLWGAETLYRLIQRLESHKKPECKILQKLEEASLRWTTTSQATFNFLEWLAALPSIKSIQADGISTQVVHTPGRILDPQPSSLTRLEFHGQFHGTETLEGLLQAARSLKCFIYHHTTKFGQDWKKEGPPIVGGGEICSVLSRYAVNSLEKLKTDLFLSVEDLSTFQRLKHLYAPLTTLPIIETPGQISPALMLPPSLEHLILPQYRGEKARGLVKAVVNAKHARWPHLKNLTLQYPCFDKDDEELREWAESATKDLAEVGVEFRCVAEGKNLLDDKYWFGSRHLFEDIEDYPS